MPPGVKPVPRNAGFVKPNDMSCVRSGFTFAAWMDAPAVRPSQYELPLASTVTNQGSAIPSVPRSCTSDHDAPSYCQISHFLPSAPFSATYTLVPAAPRFPVTKMLRGWEVGINCAVRFSPVGDPPAGPVKIVRAVKSATHTVSSGPTNTSCISDAPTWPAE